MAQKNPGDILTCDWNPFVGCERLSAGCARCWFLDGIYPWQQRLGNIPADQAPDDPLFFSKRWTKEALAAKNGIVGVCQHGDLFWDRITDEQIGLSRISTGTDLTGGIKKIVFSKRGLEAVSRDNDLIAFFISAKE